MNSKFLPAPFLFVRILHFFSPRPIHIHLTEHPQPQPQPQLSVLQRRMTALAQALTPCLPPLLQLFLLLLLLLLLLLRSSVLLFLQGLDYDAVPREEVRKPLVGSPVEDGAFPGQHALAQPRPQQGSVL
eukprot:m.93377 g.93377  ORF g.93377 m.93377 type:complete len:129 (-) comp15371_c1_seq3:660-1046(-)